MRKVISFSLYGDNPKYTLGAIKNIDLHLNQKIYKDWIFRFYVNNTVPQKIIDELKSKNAEIINMDDSYLNNFGMIWRFLVLEDNDIDIFIVRDVDSRISKREENAVNEWIKSDKEIHVIRDHLHHFHKNYPIQGGLWGHKNYIKKIKLDNLKNFVKINSPFKYFDDMKYLTNLLKSHMNNILIHDNWLRTPNSVKFKDKRLTKNFIGEGFNIVDNIEIPLWPIDKWKMENNEWVPLG